MRRVCTCYHYDRGQYEQYLRTFNLMGTFSDQKYSTESTETIQEFIKVYEQYAKTMVRNKGIKMENTFC